MLAFQQSQADVGIEADGDLRIGYFQQFHYPENKATECIYCTYSDFTTRKSVMVYDEYFECERTTCKEIFRCPICGVEKSYMLDHSGAVQCGNCKINYQRYGNMLAVWK